MPPVNLHPAPTRGFLVASLISIWLRKVQPRLSLALDAKDGNIPGLYPTRSGETAGTVAKIAAGVPVAAAAREADVAARDAELGATLGAPIGVLTG